MLNAIVKNEKQEGENVCTIGFQTVLGKTFFREQIVIKLLMQSMKSFRQFWYFF